MKRLDTERQKQLEPKRMEYAIQKIQQLGFEVKRISDSEINFQHKGHTIKFFPYSGWATGSTIKDGRGLNKLLTQLKS
ncbi:MAG: hypothetical protein NC410_09225 [Oscillibacter sp.]|nr:hypothetical protein [Oscillibacter sp.]